MRLLKEMHALCSVRPPTHTSTRPQHAYAHTGSVRRWPKKGFDSLSLFCVRRFYKMVKRCKIHVLFARFHCVPASLWKAPKIPCNFSRRQCVRLVFLFIGVPLCALGGGMAGANRKGCIISKTTSNYLLKLDMNGGPADWAKGRGGGARKLYRICIKCSCPLSRTHLLHREMPFSRLAHQLVTGHQQQQAHQQRQQLCPVCY